MNDQTFLNWISQVLGQLLESNTDLQKVLKSGVILCKLLNKIKPGTIGKYNEYVVHPLMEAENINLYLKGCWGLGIESSNIFLKDDLVKGKNLDKVKSNLVAVSTIGGSLGFDGPLLPGTKKMEFNEDNDGLEELEELEEDIDSIKKENQELKDQLDRIQIDLNKSRGKEKILQKKLDELKDKQSNNDNLKSSNSNNPNIANISLLNEKELDRRVKVISEKIEKELEIYKTKNEKLETSLNKIKSEKLESDNQRIKRDKQIDDLTQQLEEIKKSNNTEKKILMEENLSLKSEVELLQKQNFSQSSNQELTTEYENRIEETKWSYQKQMEILQIQINEQKETISEKNNQIQRETEKISKQYEENIEKLESEVIQLRNQLDSIQQKLTRQSIRNSKSTFSSNTGSDERIEELEELNSQYANEIQKLRTSIQQNTKKVTEKPVNRRHVMQKQNSSQNWRNSMFFFSQDVMDGVKIEDLKRNLEKLMSNKPVQFSDFANVQDILKEDSGRRAFTFILQEQLKFHKTTAWLLLSNHAFELLQFLINTTMQQIDLVDTKDFITLKVLMRLASLICTMNQNKKVFIQDFIKGHRIWNNLDFWEEYFVDKMTSLFKSKFGDNSPSEEILQDLTFNVLKNHLLELMENWQIGHSDLLNHATKLSKENNLAESKHEQILEFMKQRKDRKQTVVENEVSSIVKEGFLKQLTEVTENDRKKKKWTKMSCKLENNELKFTTQDLENKKFSVNVIPLNSNIQVVPVSSAAPSSLQSYTFQINNKQTGEQIHIMSETQGEAASWVVNINQCLDKIKNNNKSGVISNRRQRINTEENPSNVQIQESPRTTSGMEPFTQLITQLKQQLETTEQEMEIIKIAKRVNEIKSQMILSQEFHKVDKSLFENKVTPTTNMTNKEKLIMTTMKALDFCLVISNALHSHSLEIHDKQFNDKISLLTEWIKKAKLTLKI